MKKDAKWICGILLFIALHITLLGVNLYRLTAEPIAVPLLSTVIAASFSPEGLDDPKTINDVKRQLAGRESISPIPGLNLKITKADIEGKTPREMRIGFFSKLTTPLYREGTAGVAKLATDPKLAKDIESGVSFLTIISQKNHNLIGAIVKIAGLVCLLLLAGVIFFSRRFGRLFSPGLIITLVSLPGAIISFLLTVSLRDQFSAPVSGQSWNDQIIMVWQSIGPDVAAVLSKTYQSAIVIGLGLMGLALVGRIIYIFKRNKKRKEAPTP